MGKLGVIEGFRVVDGVVSILLAIPPITSLREGPRREIKWIQNPICSTRVYGAKDP